MVYMDFGFKNFTSIHDRLATEVNKRIQKTEIPEWLTKGKTTLIQKVPLKETDLANYRPKTCLPIIYKILTGQSKIYYSLISREFFSDEQKGCRKRTRGTEELLYVAQQILNESKTRWNNLAMALIDYKKSLPDQVVQFIERAM